VIRAPTPDLRNRLPCAPVAVGIINVAAASVEVDSACAAKFGSSPTRENLGVENVAFVSAFGAWSGAQEEDFPQITGGGVHSPAGGFGESGDLGSRRFQKIRKIILA
jgi:hypothetical protein